MNSWGCSVIACKSFRVRNELISPLGSAARNQHFTHEWERHASRLPLLNVYYWETWGRGGLDRLFGEVVLICMSTLLYIALLINSEHFKEMLQKYSFIWHCRDELLHCICSWLNYIDGCGAGFTRESLKHAWIYHVTKTESYLSRFVLWKACAFQFEH